jgi:hypothetical protein
MASATTPIIFGILAVGTAAGSTAFQMPAIPGMGGMGGLPNISNIGASNAAGVLGYCMKNDLLGGSKGASSLLSGLEKKPGITGTKEFAAGQAGNILTGGHGSGFNLAGASDPIKQQGCKMVMKQAHKFL